MKTYLYRSSILKSKITFWPQIHGGNQFLEPAKNHRFLRFIHNNNNNDNNNNNNNNLFHQLPQTGFLRVY